MKLRTKMVVVAATLIATASCAQLTQAAPRTPKKARPATVTKTLAISSPKSNAHVNSPLTITGTSQNAGAVSVNVKAVFEGGQQDLGTFRADTDRQKKWQTPPINLWAPEGTKKIKYEIVASQKVMVGKKTHTQTSAKTVVSPAKAVMLVPRRKMTLKEIKKINPRVIAPPRILPNPIDPITGRPRGNAGQSSSSNTSANSNTTITSPNDGSAVEIPVLIEGTAKKDSEVKIEITTTYKKYGQTITKRTNGNASSDSNGKWQLGKIYSIKVDEADSYVTHKISAFRVEGTTKTGNTATRTVVSNPTKKSQIKIIFPSIDIQANKTNHVRGNAAPGTKVEVQVTVEGTNSKGFTDAGGVRIVRDWQTVTTDSNGVWTTPSFKFDSKGRVRNIKFHITAREKDNSRNNHRLTVKGR